MKTISVIITTYNGATTIGRTLNSVLGQDGRGRLFELEIIAVDDCSTDGTDQILRTFDLRYFRTESNTGGPNRGRNIGLAEATGDHICIMDQDDHWEPDRLVSLLPYCDDFPIVSSGYWLQDASTGAKELRMNEHRCGHICYSKNETFLEKLSGSSSGQIRYLGSLMFSAELKDNRFEETFGMLDLDWALRLFHGRTSVEVCKALYTRNLHANNLSLSEAYRLKDLEFSLTAIMEYEKQFPDQVKHSRLKLYGRIARYYYLQGRMPEARKFFLKTDLSAKTILYWTTTFVGHSFVKKNFRVFG